MVAAHPRRGVLAAAVLLVVVVIGTGAAQLFSQVVSATTESSTVLAPLAERLTVDSAFSDITVVPSTDGQVHVHTVVRHGLGRPDLAQESTPSGVRLDVDCNELLATRCEVGYTVELPPSFELVVDGTAGDVTARGLTGPIRVDLEAGDVALFDVSGPVDVTSSFGEITAFGARSDSVRAESRSGDVRLELVEPPQAVQVNTQSGDVDVAVPAGVGYRVSAWTRSGDRGVSVPVDPSSPHMITMDGDSGDIRLRTR